MLLSQLSVFGCLAGVSVVLHGCGGGDQPQPATVKTTVIVMRHCVRATDNDAVVANPSYKYYDNYTAKNWAPFSVPAMSCLPRGEKIIEAQGSWIRSQPGWLPLPLRAIADNVPDGQRDNVTMVNLLNGLALDASNMTAKIDHAHFANGETAACKTVKPSLADMKTAMQEFMDANPPGPSYTRKMQKLYDLIGAGSVAGNWTSIPCTSEKSPWGKSSMPAGACLVAADLTERLLMELGAGSEMTLGWGKVTPEDVEDLLELHAWQFHAWFACPAIYKWSGASIITSVSADILEGQPGTTLYVGHDDDMMNIAGALGLSWDASPWPKNATLPGSMLRFDRDGETITASYHFVSDFTTADVTGSMANVSAQFGNSGQQVSMATFQDLVEKGSFASCAGSDTVTPGSPPIPSDTVLAV